MKNTVLRTKDYATGHWAGGSTTQIAIFPRDALYAERNFSWRVSSAVVELEESDFTPLPDYDRVISTLQGEMRLCHNGGREFTLKPFHIYAFDGGAATHSRGKCTDFNLMTRKGKWGGCVELLEGSRKALLLPQCAHALLYFPEGGRCTWEDGSAELSQGESLLLEDCGGISLQVEQAGRVLLAQMWEMA